MCEPEVSRQTTIGGLSPSDKVASLLSRDWGVMCAPALRRVKIPRNPEILRLGAVSAYLVKVSLMKMWACDGTGGKVGVLIVWVRAVGKVGFPCLLGVLISPAWRACIGACLSGATVRLLCWGIRCSLSTWTCKKAMDNARALMISKIWSI